MNCFEKVGFDTSYSGTNLVEMIFSVNGMEITDEGMTWYQEQLDSYSADADITDTQAIMESAFSFYVDLELRKRERV